MSLYSDENVTAALSQKCAVCKAPAGELCTDTVLGGLLKERPEFPRPVHLARLEP